MPDFILNQAQLDHIVKSLKVEESIKTLDKFSDEEKKLMRESFGKLNSNTKLSLNEAEWYNTLGDILGIIDPTGLVDFTNGLSYISQGDYFFGLLSMVAVMPYIGDVIAKPLMGVGKSSKLFKGMDTALALAKNGKTYEASLALEKAASQSSLIQKFVNSSLEWGGKLKSAVKNIPMVPSGFKKVITDWIDLFQRGLGKSQQAKRLVGSTKFTSKVAAASPKDAASIIKHMRNMVSKNAKTFKTFKANDPKFMAKYFWPGSSLSILGKNRDLISLFRRTKFYAGFLDFLGLGNFVGPEELATSVPNVDAKMQEYASSPQGQSIWSQEFGGQGTDGTSLSPVTPPSSQQSTQTQLDPLSWLMGSLVSK